MILTGAGNIFAQNASFTASKTAGCVPLTVNFTNTSDAGATAYEWDFGLGANATSENADKIFTAPGTYEVVLTVTYPSGTRTARTTIMVYAKPAPAFTPSITSGCTPLSVGFTDQSTPGSGTISSIVWDFGDGNTLAATNPTHTYTVGGIFNVSTIVTNSFGCTEGITRDRLITIGETPDIDFTSDVDASCTSPLRVAFRSTGPAGLTYSWDFGDGSPLSTAQHPEHIYQNEGRYTVTLRARTPEGCEGIVRKADYIVIERTRPDFTTQGPACAGTNVQLVNTTSPRPAFANWTFPDGSTSVAIDPVYFFPAPGDYSITLTSGMPGCMETTTKRITVHPRPVASFTANPPLGCAIPFNTTFTSSSSGATNWQWAFGDGRTGTGATVPHTYNNFGDYDVTLRVQNDFGCTDEISRLTYIRVHEPQAQLNISDWEGCLPHSTSFSVSMLTPGTITAYQWDLGDGTTSTSPNPSHTYTTEDSFHIRVTITISGGCQMMLEGLVRAGREPVVAFDASPKNPCAREAVTFHNQSVPRGTEWFWYLLDDNATIVGPQDSVHFFNNEGLHDVLFTVSNYGCYASLLKENLINIRPPIANFDIHRPCDDRYKIVLIDNSQWGPPDPTLTKSYLWDFGDGNTSTAEEPEHTYAATGVYTISLTVDNGDCQHTRQATIRIIDEKPVITTSAAEICAGTGVTFTRSGTDDSQITDWAWIWDDGSYSASNAQQVPRVFYRPGTYNVRLQIVDVLGCTAYSNTIPIKVNGVNADYSVSGRNCTDDKQLFTDMSSSFHGYAIKSWTWNFNDNSPLDSLLTKPVNYEHAFANPGTYNVTLSVIDVYGCHSTVTHQVTAQNVRADFQTASNIACLNQPMLFSNTSTGGNLQYKWYFEDETMPITTQHPLKAFTQPGLYNVALTVTNPDGCKDSIMRLDYIRVPDPQAKFSVPADLNVCPPVLAQFTNQSTGYQRSVWDFGDGGRSNLESPSHVYNLPGTYTVTLNAYSEGDCMSTTTADVRIKGPIGTRTMTPKEGCAPHEVTFNAVSNNAVKYIWDTDEGVVTTTTVDEFKYTYNRQGVFYPRVILEDAEGCQVPAQGPEDSIIIDGAQAAFTLDSRLACDSGMVFFSNASTAMSNTRLNMPLQYRWDFGMPARADNESNAANPAYYYRGIGTYQAKMVVTTFYGCKDSLTLPVTVEPRPETFINPAGPFCAGDSIRMSGGEGKQLAGTRWEWFVDNISTSDRPPRLFYPSQGSHQVMLVIRNPNGTCPDTATRTVTVNPMPELNVTPKQASICLGQSLQLFSNASPAQFTWTDYNISSTASANPTVSPQRDTTYRVTAINSFGCIRRDSARLMVSMPFTIQSIGATICAGRQTQLHATGAIRYRWFPETGLNNASIADPLAGPATTTQYRVVGYGNDACFTDTAEVLLTVNPSPILNPGPERIVPAGAELQLDVQHSPDVVQWQWFPADYLSCTDCPAPVAIPKENVTYNISATNQYGCTSIALLPLKLICPGSTAFIPNTFSPNGDGQNDLFYIRGRGIKKINSFKIFNRWGQLVFERANCQTDDPSCGWDGKFNGTLLNPDVYVYVAEAVCDTNEPLTLKGNVTLIR